MTIDSALLSGLGLLAFYRREAPNTISFRQPLFSHDLHARAIGRAVLASLSGKDRERALSKILLTAYTPNTITDRDKLETELATTQTRGFAVNNEEFFLGLLSIGAPLKNFQSGEVFGAVSFDFPLREHPLDTIVRNYSSVLMKLANDLSDIMTITEN
jgi:DNA-binding IclR family transcriptional regulator